MPPDFVLITTAKNEQHYLPDAIESVVKQSHRPKAWIIVNDGSTDQTGAIISRYSRRHDFIKQIDRSGAAKRNFGSKALAINEAVAALISLEFDYLGIIDADITLGSDYFEKLLIQLSSLPRIGIGGGVILEKRDELWIPLPYNYSMSVAGAVQMFKRKCFLQIGGYLPSEIGGIDMIAETTARLHGWQTATFPELRAYHHRSTGASHGSALAAHYHSGEQEYATGYSLLFQLVRLVGRAGDKPIILASLARTLGYIFAFARRQRIVLPDHLVRYLRKEQMTQILEKVGLHRGTGMD